MTKEQRAVWYALGEQMQRKDWSLCSFCRLAEWSGGCEDGWMECKHPLRAIRDTYGEDGGYFGSQCWGFRPTKGLDIQLAADCVGVILQGFYPDWFRGEREPTPHEVRVFDRLVVIGELKPYVLA